MHSDVLRMYYTIIPSFQSAAGVFGYDLCLFFHVIRTHHYTWLKYVNMHAGRFIECIEKKLAIAAGVHTQGILTYTVTDTVTWPSKNWFRFKFSFPMNPPGGYTPSEYSAYNQHQWVFVPKYSPWTCFWLTFDLLWLPPEVGFPSLRPISRCSVIYRELSDWT